MIYADVVTLESEKKQPADWQKVLSLTIEPKRVFICECDPILMVDKVIEQLTHEQLKTFVDELIFRTKLFF